MRIERKLSKKKGSFILSIFAMFTFLLIYILFMFIISEYKIVSESEILHDSLVSSNLAALSSKNLDLDLLGQDPSKKIVEIKNPSDALATFEQHLKYNFSLDNEYMPKNKFFIKSKVTIKEFIIYNVNAATGDITEYDLNNETMLFNKIEHPGSKGVLKTPNGNVVRVTTIHSNVSFDIEVMFNKLKTVDVSEDTGTGIK